MTIGVVIICRYSSERLPGKILCNINGRTVLSHIVERIKKAAPKIPIVIATSEESSDDPIASYCRRSGLEYFRGSLDDVADRFLSCAESYGWEYAVRINGDNLFIDFNSLREMLAIAGTGNYDFVTNVPGRTFPYGMSIEIVRTKFYCSEIANTEDADHHEHVTSWLYEHPDTGHCYVYKNKVCPEAAGMRLALDTPEDLNNARRIMENADFLLTEQSLLEIYNFITREENSSPWQGSSGPLLIAEIGGNHEGDFDTAKKMTELAISSGADCVKFQLYKGNTLVSPIESPERNQHFKKFELTQEQHVHLAEMCREANVSYLASVWDLEMLDWIDQYLNFYKIGSGDMTAWPILEEFARRGKPILLSTGLSTMDEVLQAVGFLQRANPSYSDPDMLAIMQCTSMYPIPDKDANLLVMDAFRAATRLSIGYSDHTIGIEALRTAAAMGAKVLEFHFTDTREGKTFRDHQVSLIADEVKQLKQDIEQITTLRGSSVKTPQVSEINNKHEISFRRGVYLCRPKKPGDIIHADDLVYLRPAHGTDARDTELVIGAKVLRNLESYRALQYGSDYIIPM